MVTQTCDEQNRQNIHEFLSRGPVIQATIQLLDFPPESPPSKPEDVVQVDTEIIEDETDVAISGTMTATRSSGFTITGDAPTDLKEGINAFYNTMCFDLLGQQMTEDSLMQPIRLLSAFLEGIKSFGRISDYDIRFDPERSSNRLRAVGYSIAITATDPSWWENVARNLWDSFANLVLDPNAPTLAVRITEVLPKWIEALIEILRNFPMG